jgi:hypothetical protein
VLQKNQADTIRRFYEKGNSESQEQAVGRSSPKFQEIHRGGKRHRGNNPEEERFQSHRSPSQISPYTNTSMEPAAVNSRHKYKSFSGNSTRSTNIKALDMVKPKKHRALQSNSFAWERM